MSSQLSSNAASASLSQAEIDELWDEEMKGKNATERFLVRRELRALGYERSAPVDASPGIVREPSAAPPPIREPSPPPPVATLPPAPSSPDERPRTPQPSPEPPMAPSEPTSPAAAVVPRPQPQRRTAPKPVVEVVLSPRRKVASIDVDAPESEERDELEEVPAPEPKRRPATMSARR